MNLDTLDCVCEAGEINYFDRVRSLDIVCVSEGCKRISNLDVHLKFLLNLSLEARRDIFSVINVAARNFVHAREEFFGVGPLREEYFLNSIKIVVVERTSGYNLLAVCRNFAVMRNRSEEHTSALPSLRRT